MPGLPIPRTGSWIGGHCISSLRPSPAVQVLGPKRTQSAFAMQDLVWPTLKDWNCGDTKSNWLAPSRSAAGSLRSERAWALAGARSRRRCGPPVHWRCAPPSRGRGRCEGGRGVFSRNWLLTCPYFWCTINRTTKSPPKSERRWPSPSL